MKNIYFTVGPSQTYPSVEKYTLKALKEEVFSMNHRGKKFEEIFLHTQNNLKKLLLIPEDYYIFLISSGTESMERIMENCVEKSSIHVINGKFAERFYKTALELGKDAQKYEATGVFFAENLRMKAPELIAFTQNDTSTGMSIPMKEIKDTAKKFPKSLIALDTVSSMPYVDIDYKYVDCVFFSVQKGFGLPAGLGVLIISPRALEKAKRLQKKNLSIGSYHSFTSLFSSALKHQTPDTPNVFGIYLLNNVLKDFLKIGIKKIRQDTELKAKLLYEFLDKSKRFKPLIEDKSFRSNTTLVVNVKDSSKKLVKNLAKKGFILGSGYGERKDEDIRIANFPAHKLSDVKRLVELLREED